FCADLREITEDSFDEKIEELITLFPEKKGCIEKDLTTALLKKLKNVELIRDLSPRAVIYAKNKYGEEALIKKREEKLLTLEKLQKTTYTEQSRAALKEEIEEIEDLLDNLEAKIYVETESQLTFLQRFQESLDESIGDDDFFVGTP
ncbi:MAG: hypothetical protein HYZ48_02375, partial [Chlamydiales bacterium]|nr:hypothetical protein [Chlamydiales bacterium]